MVPFGKGQGQRPARSRIDRESVRFRIYSSDSRSKRQESDTASASPANSPQLRGRQKFCGIPVDFRLARIFLNY